MKNKTFISPYSGWLIGDAVIDAVKGRAAYLFANYNPIVGAWGYRYYQPAEYTIRNKTILCIFSRLYIRRLLLSCVFTGIVD
ncbi:MAG: hypothetical protein ABI729_01945 [Chitinophagales bacterium]